MTERSAKHADQLPRTAAPRAPKRETFVDQGMMWLQRTAGNSAVSDLLGRVQQLPGTPAAPPTVQRADSKAAAKINHATGKEIDSFLLASTFLKPYVEGKMKAGTTAEAAVKIQNAADFKADWVAYAMRSANPNTGKTFTKAEAETWEKDVNAFTDDHTIHVHENRGERATSIHESLHLFQDNTFYSAVGWNVSEGMTEYFTRAVCAEQKIARGTFYPSQYASIAILVGISSREKVADAYFNNKPDELKKDVDGKGAGTWDKWVAKMTGGQFTKADELLK